MFSFNSFLKSCLFLLLLHLSAPLLAQQVQKLAFQGLLKDVNGNAVPDGQQTVTFKLYKTATGGTAEWTSTQDLNVYGGVYSTYLGSADNPLNELSWGTSTYFVGITLQGIELTPRTEMTFAPYSLGSPRATLSDTADYAKFELCSGDVGDVKYSMLRPDIFTTLNGSCWVPMDGRSIAGSKLATIINQNNIPDGGGLFVRSQEFSGGANNDPDRSSMNAIASIQEEAFKSHSHTGSTSTGGVSHAHGYIDTYIQTGGSPSLRTYDGDGGGGGGAFSTSSTTNSGGNHSHTLTISNNTGNETRPKNLNFWVYIRIN